MNIPDPVPGLDIRYAYLWSHDAKAGHEEGIKDRPCAILLSAVTKLDFVRLRDEAERFCHSREA